MRYVDVQSMLDASQPDGLHNYWQRLASVKARYDPHTCSG